MKLYYRVSATTDGALLKKEGNTYDGLVIAGHVQALHPVWTGTLLRELSVPFFVDPESFIFAQDLGNIESDGERLKSYKALESLLGSKVQDIVQGRELQPSDFVTETKENEELINELVECVIKLQRTASESGPVQTSLAEYSRILNEDFPAGTLPEFIIPPYFYFRTIDDSWYKINLLLAKKTKEKAEGLPVYIVLCMAKELLGDQQALSQVAEDVDDYDGCLLWLSDFQERSEREANLTRLAWLVRYVASRGKPVINLYGGTFSAMLHVANLTGYSRGICTSEYRDVDAQRGEGAPPSRYYIPEAHTKVVEANARRLYSSTDLKMCDCSICNQALSSITPSNARVDMVAQLFDTLKQQGLRAHFMHAHKAEREQILSLKNSQQLKEWVSSHLEVLSRAGARPYVPLTHLEMWVKALDQFTI